VGCWSSSLSASSSPQASIISTSTMWLTKLDTWRKGWPLQDHGFTSWLLHRNQSPVYGPLPTASSAQLQYYCTSIAQHTTPPRSPFCMLYTMQYWQWQYRVKANAGSETPVTRGLANHHPTCFLPPWYL